MSQEDDLIVIGRGRVAGPGRVEVAYDGCPGPPAEKEIGRVSTTAAKRRFDDGIDLKG